MSAAPRQRLPPRRRGRCRGRARRGSRPRRSPAWTRRPVRTASPPAGRACPGYITTETTMAENNTAAARNAALRAEIQKWTETAGAAPDLFVNLRAMGHATKQDAERWARANEVPFAPVGSKLL